MLLKPKNTKFKKYHKGRMDFIHKNKDFCYGQFAIISQETANLTNKQLNTSELAIKRVIKKDGSLLIYDWKRCKEIVKTSGFGKWGQKECIEHLPDTNYWHYCLQLNTYKAILEDKYGKKVEELYLVCLHPENKNKNYQRIKVVDLQEEVRGLFDMRKKELANKSLKI